MSDEREPSGRETADAEQGKQPTIAELDAALRAYVDTHRAMLLANEANQQARRVLAEILQSYGLNGFVP